MIAVDSSALIAILKEESEAERFRLALSSSVSTMAAPTKIEVMMVAGGRFGQDGIDIAQRIISDFDIAIAHWTEALSDRAVEAFMRYGKGRGHPAGLNFGDCMAYALAKSLDAPLLFKGDDFGKTDIRRAL